MKALAFIVVFFYLGSLLPTAQAAAYCSQADSKLTNKQVALAPLAATPQAINYLSDTQSDGDQPALLWQEPRLHRGSQNARSSVAELVSAGRTQGFLARAPPFSLS